jgi:hypothetical protein
MVMDVMPWQAVVFISIPEAFLVNLMGFTLVGVKPDLKRLGMVAVAQACASFFIRSLPMVYGVHMILQVITTIAFVKFIMGYQFIETLPAVFLGFAIFAGIIDQIYIPFILRIIPLEVILNNAWMRVLVSIPEQAIMLIIILLCKKYRFKVFDVTAYKEGM